MKEYLAEPAAYYRAIRHETTMETNGEKEQPRYAAPTRGEHRGGRSGVVFSSLGETDIVVGGQLAGVHRWVTGFLSKPHRDLGRQGDVCPFTGSSLEREKFWVAEVQATELPIEAARGLLEDAIEIFDVVSAKSGADAQLVTTVIVMPNIVTFDGIEAVQKLMKDEFVTRGLMIGQFYPGCSEAGLWNPEFRPLDAPYPMLAVRHMVPSDLPFLVGKEPWLAAYLKRFAPKIPAKFRAQFVQALIAGSTIGAVDA